MKTGIIGVGHMGGAMLRGMVGTGNMAAENLLIYDKNESLMQEMADTLGVLAMPDAGSLAKEADVVILAVNPRFIEGLVSEIRDSVTEHTLVVSVALGQTIEMLEGYFAKPVKLVRAMPNTPALVGAAMIAVAPNAEISEAEYETVRMILGTCGRTEPLQEEYMEAAVSVSGSSPAYVYMFIEAMADAAVIDGMPRDTAYKFAAQAVLGSAKMVLETGKHPGELKDAVCTPGGSTIAAVRVLEEKGFRSAVIEGMQACTNRAKGKS